jgi:hypothetical protein
LRSLLTEPACLKKPDLASGLVPSLRCGSDLHVEPDAFVIRAACATRPVENIAMPLGALEFLMADSFDDFSGRFVSAREVVLAAIGARRYAPALPDRGIARQIQGAVERGFAERLGGHDAGSGRLNMMRETANPARHDGKAVGERLEDDQSGHFEPCRMDQNIRDGHELGNVLAWPEPLNR